MKKVVLVIFLLFFLIESVFAFTEGQKNSDKYTPKEVFLISDKNWKDVLELVPATTWTTDRLSNAECRKEKNKDKDWCWCNRLPTDYINLDDKGVCAYPMLVFHEEEHPSSVLELSERKLLEETSFTLSLNFKDNVLSEGKVNNGEGFTIPFSLYGDQYEKISQGNSKISLLVTTDKEPVFDFRDPVWPEYEIFLNGHKIEGKSFSNYEKGFGILRLISGNEQYFLKEGENELVFRDAGGKVKITGYTLLVDYFSIFRVDSLCKERERESDRLYNLCIKDISLPQDTIFPGEEVTYQIMIENQGSETFDFSGEDYIVQGESGSREPWILRSIPYSFALSHISTTIPQVKLNPGESIPADVTLRYYWPIPQNSIDADSVIYFLQQYKPNKLTVVGEIPENLGNALIAPEPLGASLENSQISQISPDKIKDRWRSYGRDIFVERNYKKSLLASSYASLLNVPLVVVPVSDDGDTRINHICVGSDLPGVNCNRILNVGDLQKEYRARTKTDKVILTNPSDSDVNLQFHNVLVPKSTSGSVINLFKQNSLLAPILASAKHEIIIPIEETKYEDMDRELKQRLYSLYPEINGHSQYCSVGDSCFEGTLEDIELTQLSAENNLMFQFAPSRLSEDKHFSLFLRGALTECANNQESLSLYNNGKLVSTITVPCYDSVSVFTSDVIYFKINDLEPGTIELRYNGVLKTKEINIWVENYNNRVWNCHAFNSQIPPCIIAGDVKTSLISKPFARGRGDFTFTGINPNLQYLIELKNYDSNKVINLNTWVNGEFLGELSITNPLIIPPEILQDKLEVVVYPITYINPEPGSDINYDIELELKSSKNIFLTVLGSPNAIPYREFEIYSGPYYIYRSLDQTQYGDLSNDGSPDMQVGRIMGFSTSDVSSYLARNLFYNSLLKTKNMEFMASRVNNQMGDINNARDMAAKFSKAGYNPFLDIHEDEDQ